MATVEMRSVMLGLFVVLGMIGVSIQQGGTQFDYYPYPNITKQQAQDLGFNRNPNLLTVNIRDQPRDCADIMDSGVSKSGYYKIFPVTAQGTYFYVYCDMETEGGGWTVIYRRCDGSQEFYRGWWFYACGFGDINGEYFLGLHKINWLTTQRPTELKVVLTDVGMQNTTAGYSHFEVANETENFALHVQSYYGDAGDYLYKSNGRPFSTFDRDNDGTLRNCAEYFHSAWWYHSYGECQTAVNLFGYYFLGEQELPKFVGPGLSYKPVPGPGGPAVKKVLMMIRPMGFLGQPKKTLQSAPPAQIGF